LINNTVRILLYLSSHFEVSSLSAEAVGSSFDCARSGLFVVCGRQLKRKIPEDKSTKLLALKRLLVTYILVAASFTQTYPARL
jgi:hypothetical protein